jgi:hypothetical protein
MGRVWSRQMGTKREVTEVEDSQQGSDKFLEVWGRLMDELVVQEPA